MSSRATRSPGICWKSRSARAGWPSSTVPMTSGWTAGSRSKCSRPSLAADNAFRTRFIRESRAAATVEHPHIIPVYDAGDAGGCLFISMRYVQGGDVRSLLADGQGAAAGPGMEHHQPGRVRAGHGAHARPRAPRRQAGQHADRRQQPGTPQQASTPRARSPSTSTCLISASASRPWQQPDLDRPVRRHARLHRARADRGPGIDGRADQYSLACAAFELLCGDPPYRREHGFALINAHLSEQPPSVGPSAARTARRGRPGAGQGDGQVAREPVRHMRGVRHRPG